MDIVSVCLLIMCVVSARALGFHSLQNNFREYDCIEIQYQDEKSIRKYYRNPDKYPNGGFEITTEKNHTIKYDYGNNNIYMKNYFGKYHKMNRQLVTDQFSTYNSSNLLVRVPCIYGNQRRFLIFADVVTNKPRRQRQNSKSLESDSVHILNVNQ